MPRHIEADAKEGTLDTKLAQGIEQQLRRWFARTIIKRQSDTRAIARAVVIKVSEPTIRRAQQSISDRIERRNPNLFEFIHAPPALLSAGWLAGAGLSETPAGAGDR
ncbi:MAG: hypothetical protein OHK0015_39520 [Chloroflexi bacterium OHK40]